MKRSAIFMLMVLLASSTLLAVMPGAAQKSAVSGDLDGDRIVSDEEIVAAEQSYQDGKITSDQLEEIRYIHKNYPKTIVDDSLEPRDVTIYKPIKRIIATNGYVCEVLRTLNSQEKIVGISKYTADQKDFFPEISNLPSVGGMNPDVEKVLSLNPDVIIAYGSAYTAWTADLEDELEGTDITLIRLDFYKPETMTDDIRKLGYILEKEEEVEEFIDWYEGHLNTINDQVDKLTEDEKPRIYIETFSADGYRTFLQGSGTHQVCEMAGGINIAGNLQGNEYTEIDPECVVEQNPDIIIKGVRGDGYSVEDPSEMEAIRKEIMSRPELADVSAVKNENVYCMNLYVRNIRYFVGVTYMAKWFHPELFQDLDPQAIHQEYLTRFQGLDSDLDEHGVFVYPEV